MGKKIGIGIGAALYFLAVYALFSYFGITCVFLEVFGIPCPGCGMTRAAAALLRMDFLEAIRQNSMVFFMPYVLVYLFFDLKSKVHTKLLGILAILAVIQWLVKIILFFGR